MKEWNICYFRYVGGQRHYIVLPSFPKVLLWFVRMARKCSDITIFRT